MIRIDVKSVLVDTEENFRKENPVMPKGFIGYESDQARIKLFDGSTDWNHIPYMGDDTGGVTYPKLVGLPTINGQIIVGDEKADHYDIATKSVVDKTIASIQALIEENKGSSDEHFKTVEEAIEANKQAIGQHDEEVDKALEEMGAKVEANAQAISAHDEEVDKALEEMNATITSNKESCEKALEETVADLTVKITSNKESCEKALEETVADLTVKINANKEAIGQHDEEVDAKVLEIESSIQSLTETVDSNKTSIEKSLEETSASLTEKIEANKQAIGQHDEEVDKALEEMNAIITSNKESCEAGDKENADSIKALSETVSANKESCEKALEETNATISSNKADLESADSALSEKIETVKQDLTTSINTKADKVALENAVSEINAEVSLKAVKTDVDATIASINAEMATKAVASEVVASLELKADKVDTYTKEEINGMIASTFHYKGTVATQADLPTQAEIGDVWNISETGANYAWNGTQWDKLSETVDLSPYLLIEKAESTYATINMLTTNIATLNGTMATKADTLSVNSMLDTKANKTYIDSVVSTINAEMATKAVKADVDALIASINAEMATKAVKADVESDLALKADKSELETAVSELNANINEKATKSEVNTSVLNLEDAIAMKANKSELKDWVEYSSIATEEKPSRKAINLAQDDVVMSGGKILTFVNEWGVAEFGGAKAHTNINTATSLVEGEKQYGVATINDDAAVLTDKILNSVLVSSGNVKVSEPIVVPVLGKDVYTYEMNVDMSGQESSITSLVSRLNALESRLSEISKTAEEEVEIVSGEVISLNDSSKDFVVYGGEATENITVASAASVEFDNISISNDAKTKISTTGETSLNNVTLAGKFTKTDSNAIVNIPNSKYVSIKNTEMTEDSSCYNAIEIGAFPSKTTPKSILIDGLNIAGETSNNAISIHDIANGGVININNCHFNKVSNVLRLSNASNATNVTINITNCSCNEWASGVYAGMILCEDTTSDSSQDFSGITINVSNFTYASEKLVAPENIADVCGTKDDSQILYVFRNESREVESYNSMKYPTLNIM